MTTVATYDVLGAEVHRKALENLTNEMATALMRTSGSPVVTDAKDFSTCLLDTTPEQLGFSAYILFHLGTSLVGTQRVASLLGNGDDLRPGDGWLVNDAIDSGAAHQGDLAIIMPMFHRNRHLGWGFVNMHVLDIGGFGISGLAPTVHDIYGEGLRFDATRVIRGGVIDPEWERFIADNVRAAGPVLNDLRGMIAANNVGNRKLNEIVETFGYERYERFCAINKDLTEELIRGRIEQLPDGIYRASERIEFDAHGDDLLLELNLRLEVKGSDLYFTYTGAEQIDGYVNTGKGGIWGHTVTALLTTLGYGDFPVNGGIWRPLHIDLGEPGTVFNALAPAPTSFGHGETGMRASKLVKDCLNQAMGISPSPVLRSRVAGKGFDAPNVSSFFGKNQHDAYSVIIYLDIPSGVGGPAQTIHDGQDAYGCTCQSGAGISDVESHETADPLTFLWRGVVPNSGGPGQFRGGQALEQAFCVTESDLLRGPSMNICGQLPPTGFGGGFPAGASTHYVARDTNVRALLAEGNLPLREYLSGTRENLRNKVELSLGRDDVFVMIGGGGSGLGDPLLREPALVATDVRSGYVTDKHARAAYGVVLGSDGSVDAPATRACREDIRRWRLGGATPAKELVSPAEVGIALLRDAASGWSCGSCAAVLGADWRAGATMIESPILERFAELDMLVRERASEPRVMMREHYCPACAAALGVDVVEEGSPELPSPELAP
jgi:N-methylhydantoinase B